MKVIEPKNSKSVRRAIDQTLGWGRTGLVALLLVGHFVVVIIPALNHWYDDPVFQLIAAGVYPAFAILVICLYGFQWSIKQTLTGVVLYFPVCFISLQICILGALSFAALGGVTDITAEPAYIGIMGFILLIWAALFAVLCFILGRLNLISDDWKSYLKIEMLFVPMSLVALNVYPTVR